MSPVTRNDEILSGLSDLWSETVAAHGVPGAQIAVLCDGAIWEAVAGKVSLTTGVDVTTDSVFQIGSITKVWTTTLVMQLVDDGLIGLDDKLITHMPEFALSDMNAAQVITIRQLLSHTSGFDGDIFRDTGRGEDAIEKFVASLNTADQVFEPGAMFSYSNTAFAVLGRLIEKKRGTHFSQVLVDHIVTPLGLANVCPSADEAILRRAAVGHMDSPDGPVDTTLWALPRSNQAAGAMLAMSAHDLVSFAQMHINGGFASDGTRVLSPESVAAMQTAQVEVPPLRSMGDFWGLGWDLTHTEKGLVIHHTGGTIGQAAFLCVVPEQRFVIAALTNGGGFAELYYETVLPLMYQLTGIEMSVRYAPPSDPTPVDLDRIGGTYSDASFDLTVRQDDDGNLWLDRVPKGIEAELGEQPTSSLMVGLAPDLIIAQEPTGGRYPVYAFVGQQDNGQASHIHYGRAVRRANQTIDN